MGLGWRLVPPTPSPLPPFPHPLPGSLLTSVSREHFLKNHVANHFFRAAGLRAHRAQKPWDRLFVGLMCQPPWSCEDCVTAMWLTSM